MNTNILDMIDMYKLGQKLQQAHTELGMTLEEAA